MPEHPVCIHCKKPIDLKNDDFVIPNKHEVRYTNEYRYAHLDCQKKAVEQGE